MILYVGIDLGGNMILDSFARTRREAVARVERLVGAGWAHLNEKGYHVRKVSVDRVVE